MTSYCNFFLFHKASQSLLSAPTVAFYKNKPVCYQHSNAPKTNCTTKHPMPGKLPAADVQLIRAEVLPNLQRKVFHVWLPWAEQLWHISTGLLSTKTRSICLNRELCPRYLDGIASLYGKFTTNHFSEKSRNKGINRV